MRSDCTGPIAGPRGPYPYRRRKRAVPALEFVRNVALARDAGFSHWHRGHSWSFQARPRTVAGVRRDYAAQTRAVKSTTTGMLVLYENVTP